MKKSALLFVTLVTVGVMFTASTAIAECPEGRVPIIIETPSGRTHIRCIPEQAADNVGGGSGVVTPLECPCFTPEIIEQLFTLLPDTICYQYDGETSTSGDPCTDIECFENVSSPGYFFWATEGPADFKILGKCDFFGAPGIAGKWMRDHGAS